MCVRNGRAVGAAVHRLQHRRLDLEISAGGRARSRSAAITVAALAHRAARLVADDEVDVAPADPQLLAHRLVRHRQRAQRLGGQLPGVGEHRQFAAARRARPRRSTQNVVAEVDVGLPGRQGLLAHPVAGEHDLQLGVALAQGGEAELAGVAEEDDPAGDADRLAGHRVRREVGVRGPDLGERRASGRPSPGRGRRRCPAAGPAWPGGPAAAPAVRRRRRGAAGPSVTDAEPTGAATRAPGAVPACGVRRPAAARARSGPARAR